MLDDKIKKNPSLRGRHPRPWFELGDNHPLHDEYGAFLRAKMQTPMLAGAPPPTFPGNKPLDLELQLQWRRDLDKYTKYMMDMILPWCTKNDHLMEFERTGDGFLQLIHEWDRKSAALINQMRFRFLHNIMCSQHRSSQNETAAGAWHE